MQIVSLVMRVMQTFGGIQFPQQIYVMYVQTLMLTAQHALTTNNAQRVAQEKLYNPGVFHALLLHQIV